MVNIFYVYTYENFFPGIRKLEIKIQTTTASNLLYLFGPSSRQNVSVNDASSSKNSVANASHQRLSLSCNKKTKKQNLDFYSLTHESISNRDIT